MQSTCPEKLAFPWHLKGVPPTPTTHGEEVGKWHIWVLPLVLLYSVTSLLRSQIELRFLSSPLRGQIVPCHICQVFPILRENRAVWSHEAVTHQEVAFFPSLEPTWCKGKQTVGTLLLQLSRETEERWDRTNPTRDSKQPPLWQFLPILNLLDVLPPPLPFTAGQLCSWTSSFSVKVV